MVLIVDDSMVMRKMIAQIIKSEAYDIVAEARNGKEAVELYQQHNPDVVTMDINMPEMDGITALNKILEINPKAIVVMLTSEGEKSTVVEAVSKGAKNYIVKPPERSNVLEKLRKALGIK